MKDLNEYEFKEERNVKHKKDYSLGLNTWNLNDTKKAIQ